METFPSGIMDAPVPLPEQVRKTVIKHPKKDTPEFRVQHPSYSDPYNERARRVWFMVWESTRLKPEWLREINKYQALVTPSDWNASCFSAAGVDIPIYKIPLFVSIPCIYRSPVPKDNVVFGCAGHLGGQTARKNIQAALIAFQRAFPGTDDVELHIKTTPGSYVELPQDKRVKLDCVLWDEATLLNWYANLDVFVHPARSEGWGFQPLQAMAIGRPVIACKYGGVAEYFDKDCGIEVDYTHVKGEESYQDCGCWAEPSVDSIAEAMLYSYNNLQEMKRKGMVAANRATKFNLGSTIKKLTPILEKYEIIH